MRLKRYTEIANFTDVVQHQDLLAKVEQITGVRFKSSDFKKWFLFSTDQADQGLSASIIQPAQEAIPHPLLSQMIARVCVSLYVWHYTKNWSARIEVLAPPSKIASGPGLSCELTLIYFRKKWRTAPEVYSLTAGA